MSDERWIVVRNWDKFQTYTDRVPPWIKLYTAELANNPEWERLSPGSRGVLVTIWVEYALHQGQLRVEVVQRASGSGWKVGYLNRLVDAGLIDVVASKPLARARPRKEQEEEKEKSARPRARDREAARTRAEEEKLARSNLPQDEFDWEAMPDADPAAAAKLSELARRIGRKA